MKREIRKKSKKEITSLMMTLTSVALCLLVYLDNGSKMSQVQ